MLVHSFNFLGPLVRHLGSLKSEPQVRHLKLWYVRLVNIPYGKGQYLTA